MIFRQQLLSYLNDLLQQQKIPDYCPNGLQVEGKGEINKIITGVSACQQLIDTAIAQGADAILVHHGYFWKNEAASITGLKQRRLAALLKNDINLFAYHLPLDIHPELGNNAQLARILNLTTFQQISVGNTPNILCFGKYAAPIAIKNLISDISNALNRTPLHIEATRESISQIAWCTGAAQDYIEEAVHLDCDVYLTGEASERTVHIAREYDIHFIAAGHHATERYGIKALGDHLAEQFGLEHVFVDIDNPV